MTLPILTLVAVLLADAPSRTDAQALTRIVREVRSADFRAQRDELRRLAAGLDAVQAPDLRAYREYWRGFALWRSAINGANEAPMPGDVRTDLEGAIQAFRRASEPAPDWIEPRIGLLFCWVGLFYAPGGDPSRPAVERSEFEAQVREIREKGERNPRALWFVGGSQFFAPPDRGGDPAKAAETYRRALVAARAEALDRAAGDVPEWLPAWGAAENLMSLAYLHTHGEHKDRAVAQAYADGALALAPDWHYVRDILLPQIQALPAGR